MTGFVLLAVLWASQAAGAAPQEPSIRAEPDTVRVGEHLRLVATVPVPDGHTLFFPDTLIRTTYVETRKPADWSVVGRRGDTTDVAVAYTLAVYRPGPTPLPPIPVVVRDRPPARERSATRLDGGGFVGGWEELPRVPDFTYVRTVIEGPEVYTAPTIFEFDLMEGASPRGAADVAGGSWSPWALALAGLLVVGLGATTFLVIRWSRTPAGRPEEPPAPPRRREPEWRRAVRELDRIRALGLHRRGAVEEFYARSSDAVRRYVETFDARWGPELTATELVRRAEGRVPTERVEPLVRVMLWAETVKFGGTRPDAAEAEEDWSSLRGWVVEAGRGNGAGAGEGGGGS